MLEVSGGSSGFRVRTKGKGSPRLRGVKSLRRRAALVLSARGLRKERDSDFQDRRPPGVLELAAQAPERPWVRFQKICKPVVRTQPSIIITMR